jgi:3-deoxy-D-manno-octulosonic-acid transferase
MVLDTIGQLKSLYNLATIVFVGGSLVKKGGHNIIEPSFFAKPVIVGSFMFNFPDITNVFLEKQAVIQVDDELELSEEIKILLLSPAKREAMGQRARRTITENRGAAAATFELIDKFIAR